mmetsp:Transcript_13452/g.19827  ORF Transcript_13452/g.19827 Transcript_13452/m.19827 type:complete len:1312 (-) Transcript_13452:194-4129(-)
MASAPSQWRNRDTLWQDFSGRRSVSSSLFVPSDRFNVDTCLSRLRRDKTQVVKNSFDAAAMTVIHAAAVEGEEHSLLPKGTARSHNGKDLPHKLMEWDRLKEIRDKALDKTLPPLDGPMRVDNGLGAQTPIINSNSNSNKTTNSTPSASTKEAAKATTASASAVMDSRAAVSRAVLCAAASIALEKLTVGFDEEERLDPLNIPQNNNQGEDSTSAVNMGSVILQAQTFGQRAIDQGLNAARRSSQRLAYQQSLTPIPKFAKLMNPFQSKQDDDDDSEDDEPDLMDVDSPVNYRPNPESQTTAWTETCLPRFLKVLKTGTGHGILCDMDWRPRHGRIAQLLQSLTQSEDCPCYGPHLIVTTHPEVAQFCQEFRPLKSTIMRSTNSSHSSESDNLRVLQYAGSTYNRRKFRQQYFGSNARLGFKESPYHVLVTSYQDFLDDYLDFAQMPFNVALLDEGFSWLAAAQSDPNSQLAQLWDQALFSTVDAHIGLATGQDWKFGMNTNNTKQPAKDAWIGITCRHRILTTPTLSLSNKQRSMTLPGLLACILPHFTDVIKEEWDRSRITHDIPSLDHLKNLLTRSIVVHSLDRELALQQLAMYSMDGMINTVDPEDETEPPDIITDEDFVAEGKISQSRRAALAWISPWMRYELGVASFQKILKFMKESNRHGHVCQEILPASVTTSSGASGAIIGSFAYRLGVRCCRSFGSEQGLRQHIAALHAPPGTWLCRTCGSDCGTSQARTHHERACGQPTEGTEEKDNSGAVFGPPGVVGKKAKGSKKQSESQDKDADGSFRVPGYRGVWVNPAGKHFVKIEKKALTNDNGDLKYFDTVDQAAREHDTVLEQKGMQKGMELNFQSDGSRIVYDENAAASAAGRGVEMLGGGSSSVVPALSVINIKDLPKDVKPLLRDPRQTSRTGGNSKRHVYAYRGVCRQARKGHDRWQSQISFGGTNHYLGTFDSEWDAAAVYAWAHLILYGEEATKKAQREGEEAAAAYEREKAAIAAGEILPSPPKPEKKKKVPKKRGKKADEKGQGAEESGEAKKQKKGKEKTGVGSAKKGRQGAKSKGLSDAALAPILSQAVAKAPVLASRKLFESQTDDELAKMACARIFAARRNGYCISDAVEIPPEIENEFRPCTPVNFFLPTIPAGGAMLLGLAPNLFGWMYDVFASSIDFESDEHEDRAEELLSEEYSQEGYNESFRAVIQGSVCVIGRASKATEQACEELGLGAPVMGGTLGDIDCHIGGTPNSCSESAAIIQYLPSSASDFQILANDDEDLVTLNGRRISTGMGSFPLFNEDICTVGSRVFVFLMPSM